MVDNNFDNNLILFDFDDTLVCSTWLSQLISKKESEDEFKMKREVIYSQTKLLDSKAVSLLKLSLEKGQTKVISNAEHAW